MTDQHQFTPKPCPFCGPQTRIAPPLYMGRTLVTCRACGVQTTRDKWNVRPTEFDLLPLLRESLEKSMDLATELQLAIDTRRANWEENDALSAAGEVPAGHKDSLSNGPAAEFSCLQQKEKSK